MPDPAVRRVLLVDTAGPVVGVAAWSGSTCLHAETAAIVAGADGWLTPAMARAVAALDGLDAVAVVTGPGAFTGLRVGIAHALGLAFARGVGVIAVPTLQGRAAAAPGEPSVLALLDARKGRLYAQHFDARPAVPVPLGPPEDVSAADLAARPWPVGTVAVGEGLAAAGPLGAVVALRPLAGDAFLRACGAILAGLEPVDPAAIGAAYLREPDAQPPPGLRPPGGAPDTLPSPRSGNGA